MSEANFSVESDKNMDRYLMALRRELHELTNEDAREIVEEIRVHILDKADGSAESMGATLAALGTPKELASRYRTQEMLKRGELGRAAKTRQEKMLLWVVMGILAVMIFAVSVVGYGLGGGLVIAGAAKLMDPRHFGLWHSHHADGTWGWGMGSLPSGEREVLGWWLVPLGLIPGLTFLVLTFRFGSWSLERLKQLRTRIA